MINFYYRSLPLVVFAFLSKPYNSPNDQKVATTEGFALSISSCMIAT